ncbi:hypothetical protein GEMRC1_000499 [Eukaryota sp. GEM-RC1]
MPLDPSLIQKLSSTDYVINEGFVDGMKRPARFFLNDTLIAGVYDELAHAQQQSGGGFLPALQQLANVATLPGQAGMPVALPDMHSGYGFPIGAVMASDLDHPDAVICPGGIGFDINCGVRLIVTNLTSQDIEPVKKELADTLFTNIPVGVGTGGTVKLSRIDLEEILNTGVAWAIKKGFAWPEDATFCEEEGSMKSANHNKVSQRAKKRGMTQLGTLGAGNHYLEVQSVREVFDTETAEVYGLSQDQVCVMIHCGSRGLGHQVASDSIQVMEQYMRKQKVKLNDRQLAYAPFHSPEGQDYFAAMSASANYAWCNRQVITHLVRESFSQVFGRTPKELGMYLMYDVSHNVAKIEQLMINQKLTTCLVHRKGSTRALPKNHEFVPTPYKSVGHPVLVGGTMSDSSYVLAGNAQGIVTYYSSCHGAGRALSRAEARRTLTHESVLQMLKRKNIEIRVGTPKLVMEEASESYKSVDEVVDTCQVAGLSRKVIRLQPLVVVKG